jgi:hypothetical protein
VASAIDIGEDRRRWKQLLLVTTVMGEGSIYVLFPGYRRNMCRIPVRLDLTSGRILV